MGWSWSLALCQNVLIQVILEAGFAQEEIVQDRSITVRLSTLRPHRILGYVDNFSVLATSLEVATAGAESVRKVLEAKGLRIHPTVA